MTTTHKRFFWILAACFGLTLLPILVLNLILLKDALGNHQKTLQASQWQQRTRGITSSTFADEHLFKTLRLHDRMKEINTVILGSSTAMGISQQALPDVLHAYNYAQSAHSLSAAIDEATWLMAETDNVKYLIMPLDWALGWIYVEGKPTSIDISAAAAMQEVQSAARIPLLDRMRDALTYPRIVNLMRTFGVIFNDKDAMATFRFYFLQNSSDEYRCADGSLAKDFLITHRGSCAGVRFDGSATFANRRPVRNAQPLIDSATELNTRYTDYLVNRQGQPNPEFLRRLAGLARQAEQKGGKLLLFMPPLLPGMENAFLEDIYLSVYLLRTKQILNDWAAREEIVIFDAGKTERAGCVASEFLDQEHALSKCYDKVFSRFWNTHTRIQDGNIIWPPGGLYE